MRGLLQPRAVLHSLRQGCGTHPTAQLDSTSCLEYISPVMRELSGAGTLQQLYRRAMQMEVDFFSAQPGIRSAPSVGMLVVDFDDTCTATDTTSQIFNTAIAATVETASGTAAPKRPRMHSAQHALGSRSIIQNAVLAAYMHFKPVCSSCCKF